MAEDVTGGLFDDEPDAADGGLAGYDQAGPDLFGMEPDELILPTEPTPVDDPDMEIDLDDASEIPIDPDDVVVESAIPDAAPEPPLAPPPARASRPAPSRPETPMALYRRYRPETFAEVIGQEHVTEPLQRALTNNRVNHAYLFSGPRGCGKTTSARILARCLNCEQGPTPTPCGVCASCRDLARGGGGSIDVIEIDAASHGGVDEARDLRERAFFAPVSSRYKIYIIDEAHMVTPQGFNALLKLVEEPPSHVKFIFATTEPEKVIGTIRSRTHHYPFRLVPPRTLTSYLADLCTAEGVEVDPAVLPLVVRAGAGSVRDSLSVLDQLLGGAAAEGVSYEQATRLLGYTPDSLLDEVVDAFAAGDAHGVFACIDKVMEVGQDPRRFAEDLLRRLRDLIVVSAVPDALSSGLVDVAADQAERLVTQANGLGAGELARAAEVMATGLTDMRGTTAPRLHLELMCARVLLPGADVDDRGVHARLDRIERRLSMAAATDLHAARPEQAEQAAPAVHREQAGQARPGASSDTGQGSAPDAARGGRPRGVPRPQASAPAEGAGARPSGEGSPSPVTSAPSTPAGRGGPAGGTDPGDPWAAPWPDAAPSRPQEESARAPQASAPERSAPSEPNAPAQPTPPREPEASAAHPDSDPSILTTARVRSQWPEVLEAIKGRRRVTWIVVRENAQVHGFADGVLTLAFNNAGAQESFSRGGSDQVVREAVLQVLGVAPTIRAVAAEVDAGEQPPAPRANPAPPAHDPQAAALASRGAEQARANIQDTQVGFVDEPDDEGSPDDVDLDDGSASADELLASHLGAQLISEEEPRP